MLLKINMGNKTNVSAAWETITPLVNQTPYAIDIVLKVIAILLYICTYHFVGTINC